MSLETDFHRALEDRCAEWCELQGGRPMRNHMLPNGKIADLIYLGTSGSIVIIEVKTTLKDSLLYATHQKYGNYCTVLWVAAPLNEAQDIDTINRICDAPSRTAKIGLLGVTDRSVRIIRKAQQRHVQDVTKKYMRWQIKELQDASIVPVERQPNA